MTSFRKTVTSLPFFQFTANLEQPGSWIPNAQSVKLIFFINGNLWSYKNRTKKYLTQLSHYCFDKGTILAGKADFLKKMQYKRYKKVYLLKLHMIVYLCAKFKVFSIILTSFRHGGGRGGGVILLLLHPTQNEHLKSPSGLGLKNIKSTAKFSPIFSTLI